MHVDINVRYWYVLDPGTVLRVLQIYLRRSVAKSFVFPLEVINPSVFPLAALMITRYLSRLSVFSSSSEVDWMAMPSTGFSMVSASINGPLVWKKMIQANILIMEGFYPKYNIRVVGELMLMDEFQQMCQRRMVT